MLVLRRRPGRRRLLIKPIINRVLPGERLAAVPLLGGAIILVAYLAKGLGSYFSTYLMTDIGQRVVRDMRNQLFRHILNQSAAFFSRRTTGQLMSRITNDVGQVQQAVSETVGDLLREGLSVIGYAALMFYYDWRLALVSFTSAPLVIYPLVRLGQRVRRSTRRSQEQLEQLSHLTAEAFTGHRIVKAFGGGVARSGALCSRVGPALPHEPEDHQHALAAAADHGVPRRRRRSWPAVVRPHRIAAGAMTPGDFLGFIFAAFMLYTPIKRLSRVNANLQQAMAAATRIFELLDTHSEVMSVLTHGRSPPFARAIEFQDVSFAYDDGRGRSRC